ncbi:hypothetical protein RN001_003778 [Aquatica leii]|uniref:Uncharacterized protein n=1 Tax=Aquatica leii TaxID=1421715 RepID=A0AAN7SL01_9COLE|nr:hypothetical protein RN001_003778 [Aquatica leii]
MATELKTLRFKRGIFKQQLTNFEKYLQSLNKECLITEDFTNLKKRLEKVELIFDPFEQFQNDIELLTFENEDEYTRECNERESFENSFYLLTSKANSFLDNQQITFRRTWPSTSSVDDESVSSQNKAEESAESEKNNIQQGTDATLSEANTQQGNAIMNTERNIPAPTAVNQQKINKKRPRSSRDVIL